LIGSTATPESRRQPTVKSKFGSGFLSAQNNPNERN
jgi:hypothetical protein